MMWGNQMWSSHWMFGGYMWIVWLAVLVGLIFLVRAIVQSPNRRDENRTESRPDTPLQILEKRYARGDISKEEFTERKKVLSA